MRRIGVDLMKTKQEYIDALERMEQAYYNFDGCMSAINIFNEGVHLLTGLVNEHFEEKTETNLEIYFDDIGIFGINGFAVVNGKPMRCKDVHCDKCDFGGHCGGERLIWLASPYKKPPYKLSQFEYDLIQTYSYVHEGYTLSKFKRLIKLKDKGYFKCADYDTKIQDILSNCEVIKQ